jgi:hypothetical protein
VFNKLLIFDLFIAAAAAVWFGGHNLVSRVLLDGEFSEADDEVEIWDRMDWR